MPEQVVHVEHPEVTTPSESQTFEPESARARVHRSVVCDGWCRGTVRGRGLLGGSAKAREPRVTHLRCRKNLRGRLHSRLCSRWCKCCVQLRTWRLHRTRSWKLDDSCCSRSHSRPRKPNHRNRSNRRCDKQHCRTRSWYRMFHCAQEKAAARLSKEGKHGRAAAHTSPHCSP